MDPVSALGLASNVIQFVTFAKDLIATSIEIHNSTSGDTGDALNLNTVYGRLRDLGEGLKSCSEYNLVGPGDAVKAVSAIKEISRSSETDCQKLLDILHKLKATPGSRSYWKSFRTALRKFWEQHEISQLEDRLNKTAIALTLHICTIIGYWQSSCNSELRALREESTRLGADQVAKLGQIQDALRSLETRIGVTQSQPIANQFTPDDVASLEKQLQGLSISQKVVAKEQAVLRGLTFPSRPVRHTSITNAHRETFRWVFQTSIGSTTTNLAKWLESGGGIFWVSGKPGSGKSTLMKFLTDHPKTKLLLSQWSSCKVIIASHYFWSAGSKMQKSQQGLLQELLYDIFCQCPDLIPVSCGERVSGDGDPSAPWSLPELREVLQEIAYGGTSKVKFCFFIDGLDEYDGDHDEICQILQQLAKSPHIKLCLASRPWNVFEDAFGHDISTKIYIQDLTRDDIRAYAECRLKEHPRWSAVAAQPAQGDWLVQEITDKACGVFLWVFLVTKLLREGLTNRDTFSDIRRRLEGFPLELEDFFRQILESVEPFYHSKMSSTLQITLAADEPLKVAVYDFHEKEYDDEDYVLRVPNIPLTIIELKELREQMRWRLNSRTRGLLEIDANDTVSFLHRTVKDFLKTQAMSDFLATKAVPRFSTNLTLFKALIALVKRTGFPTRVQRRRFGLYDDSSLTRLAGQILEYAMGIFVADPSNTYYHRFLDELDRCILKKAELDHAFFEMQGLPVTAFLRELLIVCGLVPYLDAKLSENPYYLSDIPFIIPCNVCPRGMGLIEVCLASDILLLWRNRGAQILRRILETQDIDINRAWKIGDDDSRMSTLWSSAVSHITHWGSEQCKAKFWRLLENDILWLMLARGADPNALMDFSTGTVWVNYLLLSFKVPPDIEQEDLYLRTLDQFLRMGADLTPVDPLVPPSPRQGIELTPVYHTFFNKLFSASVGPSRHNINYRLLSEVTHRLLSKVRDNRVRWPMEFIRPAIKGGFPLRYQQYLESQHPEILQVRSRVTDGMEYRFRP